MLRNLFLIMALWLFVGAVVAEGSDADIVTIIIEKCGDSSLVIENIALFENGRVIELNLTNRDFSKDGVLVIPSEIGLLTELKELMAMNNAIKVLPPEIGKCTNLEVVNFANNQLAAIPSEIGQLKHLVKLDLRHNDIVKLPSEIGRCVNLECLWLWGNKLTSLDPAITRLHRLKELYLKDNRLTTLPVGIIRMRFNYIDLLGNRLCNLSTVLDHWAKKIDDTYKSTQICK